MDYIAPCGAKKSTFWPYSRKKIVCNTGKTFILLVWLLSSLCSGIKLHTRKINFFFPSCTMYYFIFTLKDIIYCRGRLDRWVTLYEPRTLPLRSLFLKIRLRKISVLVYLRASPCEIFIWLIKFITIIQSPNKLIHGRLCVKISRNYRDVGIYNQTNI